MYVSPSDNAVPAALSPTPSGTFLSFKVQLKHHLFQEAFPSSHRNSLLLGTPITVLSPFASNPILKVPDRSLSTGKGIYLSSWSLESQGPTSHSPVPPLSLSAEASSRLGHIPGPESIPGLALQSKCTGQYKRTIGIHLKRCS